MLGIMIDKYAGDHKTTQILWFLCKEYIGTFKSTQQPKCQESSNDKKALYWTALHCRTGSFDVKYKIVKWGQQPQLTNQRWLEVGSRS